MASILKSSTHLTYHRPDLDGLYASQGEKSLFDAAPAHDGRFSTNSVGEIGKLPLIGVNFSSFLKMILIMIESRFKLGKNVPLCIFDMHNIIIT